MLFSHDTKVESLGRAPLFSDLSKDELAQLAKATEDLEVEAGRVLCREGELAQEFFVIIEGEAQVTKGDQQLGTLGDGDFFGEIALIVDIPRTATVTATSPVRLLVVTDRAFRGLIEEMPSIATKVLQVLGERLHADAV